MNTGSPTTGTSVMGRLRRAATDYPWGLLWNFALRELRGKYKRSVLGWGWSVLNPIVFLAVYSFVFGLLFRGNRPAPGDPSGIDVFAFFLVAGYLPWTLHTNIVNGSVGSLVANGPLIRKVYFPRSTLPGGTAVAWLATFLVEMSVLVVALAVFERLHFGLLPFVLVAALVLTAFSLGIGLMLSSLNAILRDIEYLTTIGLQVWFWATPIVYPATLLTDRDTPITLAGVDLLDLYRLNPMYHFVGTFRALLYDQRLPGWGEWGVLLGWATVAMVVGILVFRRIEPRLADEL